MADHEAVGDDYRHGIGRESAGCQQEVLLYVSLILLTGSA